MSSRPWSPNEELPLAGVRILAMEQALALPSGTRHLAYLGADVIWVQTHKRGITSGGADIQKNKRRLSIDLAAPGGPEVFKRVAANVDVFCHNFTPGVVRKFGVDYKALKAVNPDIIYVSHTGFGTTGPFSDRPLLGPATEAMSGHNLLIGVEGEWPSRPGTAGYIDHTCGLNAAFVVLQALAERTRSGNGQHIDLCLYEEAVSHMGGVIGERVYGSPLPDRIGNKDLTYAVHNVYETQGFERYVAIVATHDQVPAVRTALGLDEVTDATVAAKVATMPAEAVVNRLQSAGVPSSVVADGSDMAKDEHLWSRGYYAIGTDGQPFGGPPWGGAPELDIAPVRLMGQDTRDVLREVAGYSEAEIEALLAADVVGEPDPDAKPREPNMRESNAALGIERGELSRADEKFDGWKDVAAKYADVRAPRHREVTGELKPVTDRRLRCLDLGMGAAPGYAAKLLADAGWDVVKVEPPDGDPLRQGQSRWGGGIGGAFAALNQGKRGVVVRDRAELEALCAEADVVIGDFSPQGCAASGLAREDFEKLQPRYVMVSVSPFGLTGPKADWAASELTVQAASGMMFITGEWEHPPMQLPPYAAALMGSLTAAGAACASLPLAMKDGQVRRLDVSQVESISLHAVGSMTRYARSGAVTRRENRLKFGLRMAPTRDGFIACSPGPLAASNVLGIAKLLNEPRLEDERFQTGEGRMDNWDEFFSIIVPPFATKTSQEWFDGAAELDMTFALVQTIDQVLDCPQLNSRGFFHTAPGPDGAEVRLPGPAYRTEDGPVLSGIPAPATPGQDTESVRRDWLSRA